MERLRARLGALILICFGLPAGAVGCGGGGDAAATAPAKTIPEVTTITVDLNEANISGQYGSAALHDQGESSSGISLGTRVVLEVSPPMRFPDDVQLAAIHNATCAEVIERRGFEELGATEVQTLNEVRDGRSETTAAQSLDELTAGGFAITVHEPRPPFRAVVCGDIRRR